MPFDDNTFILKGLIINPDTLAAITCLTLSVLSSQVTIKTGISVSALSFRILVSNQRHPFLAYEDL